MTGFNIYKYMCIWSKSSNWKIKSHSSKCIWMRMFFSLSSSSHWRYCCHVRCISSIQCYKTITAVLVSFYVPDQISSEWINCKWKSQRTQRFPSEASFVTWWCNWHAIWPTVVRKTLCVLSILTETFHSEKVPFPLKNEGNTKQWNVC